MYILGISAFYHDSSAVLIKDGEILFACQEERLTRIKGDASFPIHSINFLLNEAKITVNDLSCIAYYENPWKKLHRLFVNYLSFAPSGATSFATAMSSFFPRKLFIKKIIRKELSYNGAIEYVDHHMSHASSAFFPSPFHKAAILTVDGVGEWSTTTIGIGAGKDLRLIREIRYPHSIGLLYSAFTLYTGFKINSGEYKLMGLAPYGSPLYVELIKKEIVQINDDGSIFLNMKYFDFCTGFSMINQKFCDLFGGPARQSESDVTQKEMDIAKSIQVVLEEIILKLAITAKKITGAKKLCLAGGVALNCVANGKLLAEKIFEDIWIQPSAGDAGGALGAALYIWHKKSSSLRITNESKDMQKGTYLGPNYTNEQIAASLNSLGAKYDFINSAELPKTIAKLIVDQRILGLFQGRMEYGPRSLGNRSIIGDARNPEMQSTMNLKIKFRESFRPFAPSVLQEKASKYFELPTEKSSPYMLFVANVKESKRINLPEKDGELWGIEKLKINRSIIPAITHVDYSARIQTVSNETNPLYYQVIKEFDELTDCPVIINTSFNVRGEPIVCSPEDAYRCFMRTNIDFLIIGNYILDKKQQKSLQEDRDWREEIPLD